MTTLSESAFPQPDRYPDKPTVSAPIALKLPIHFQPEVIPTSYGCEVIVPILLKIPIAVQIDVSQRPPLCKPQATEPVTPFAESVQNASNSESVERRSETPFSSDSLSSEPLPSEPLPVTTDIQQQSNWFNLKKLNQLGAKLRHLYPITILAILLGSLLGAGCSSLLIKHWVELSVDRKVSITSIGTGLLMVSQYKENSNE